MISISFTLTYLQIYLISINAVAFTVYAYDKLQSLKNRQNIQRVSENRLLFITFLGGTIGSLLAMITFRHKVKKVSFIIKFSIVVILQALITYFYIKLGA